MGLSPLAAPEYKGRIVPERLIRGLGWIAVAMGLAALAPKRASRLFGLGDRSGLMRAIGARDFVIGLGLLSGRRRALWLQLQALADAVDATIVARGLRSGAVARRRGVAWLVFALGSGVFGWYQARQAPHNV
jgi:hypothetical protein